MFARLFICALGVLLTVGICGCPLSSGGYGNTLLVVNNSSYTIGEIYITPVNSDNWGQNQLRAWLYPGQSTTIGGVPDDCYEFWAVTTTGANTGHSYCFTGGETLTWNLLDGKSGIGS